MATLADLIAMARELHVVSLYVSDEDARDSRVQVTMMMPGAQAQQAQSSQPKSEIVEAFAKRPVETPEEFRARRRKEELGEL